MALSDHERQALREIELSLMADDPQFAARPEGRAHLTLQGVALFAVGLLMLVGGIYLSQRSIWFVAVSALGFLVMFGAGIWMIRGSSPRIAQPKSHKERHRSSAKSSDSGNGIGTRMEDNFRRRFGGEG